MTATSRVGQWKPGQSGNPAGRAPGTSETCRLRAAIGEHVPAIVNRLVEEAKKGDVQAARLLLERVLPPMRATEQAVSIDLPNGSLSSQGRAVILAAGNGVLAPTQAANLLTGLGTLARLVETEELEARIAALESRRGGA